VNEQNKLPVAVTLSNSSVGTPYLMMPVDMSLCVGCGNGGEFNYGAAVLGGPPKVGDSFDFTVTYSDGTQDTGTTVNGAVTGWNNGSTVVGAGDAATNLQTTAGTTPNFTWTFPSNPSDYTYQFFLIQAGGTCPNNNCTIWVIPGYNSNSNGFTYAETGSGTTGQISWDIDPTSSGDTPSVPSLTSTDTYFWDISVIDSKGNYASAGATDVNP
jgi:hypothetical protein